MSKETNTNKEEAKKAEIENIFVSAKSIQCFDKTDKKTNEPIKDENGNVLQNALIHMPMSSKYSGWGFYVDSRFVHTLESDENRCTVGLFKGQDYKLFNKGEDPIVVSEEEIKGEFAVYKTKVPHEALASDPAKSGKKTYLFHMPSDGEYKTRAYNVPQTMVAEEEDGSYTLRIPKGMTFRLTGKNDDGSYKEDVTLNQYELFREIKDKTADSYQYGKKEPSEGAKKNNKKATTVKSDDDYSK